jgi:DNA-binding response OmpR family regulator
MAIEVLIIDDDPEFSTMLRILLRGQDFQIKPVHASLLASRLRTLVRRKALNPNIQTA